METAQSVASAVDKNGPLICIIWRFLRRPGVPERVVPGGLRAVRGGHVVRHVPGGRQQRHRHQ